MAEYRSQPTDFLRTATLDDNKRRVRKCRSDAQRRRRRRGLKLATSRPEAIAEADVAKWPRMPRPRKLKYSGSKSRVKARVSNVRRGFSMRISCEVRPAGPTDRTAAGVAK